MTLQSKSSENKYRPVVFSTHRLNVRRLAQTLQQQESPVILFEKDRSTQRATDSTDSGTSLHDDLSARMEPLRQRLAIRKLKGDPLDEEEARVLSILNKRLASNLPRPEGAPEAARQALLEAKRLLLKYSDGED